jgi:hypothetical protein
VDVATGPECSGTTCGTDRHCADPTEVCERWMMGDPLACDHMICQPAITTPTTRAPTSDGRPCDGGEFPTCGGTCPEGQRCQSFQGLIGDLTVFAGCLCADPHDPRCEEPTDCNLLVLPYSHCADPSKTCIVQLVLIDEKNPSCSEAHCGDPLPVVMPTTTSTSTTTSSTSSTSTSSSTSSSTTTSLPCVSTPGTSGCFTDLGDCTILDTCSGLQWEQKQMAPGPHNVENRYVWAGCCGDGCQTMCQPNAAAKATCLATAETNTDGCTDQCPDNGGCYVERGGLAITTIFDWVNQLNAENFAGHNDWRVPTEAGFNPTGTRELESILEHPCTDVPCIDPIFGPTQPTGYWSRTGDIDRTVDAWFVNFYDGPYSNLMKREALFVRAVR